jgi:hypothetical protein
MVDMVYFMEGVVAFTFLFIIFIAMLTGAGVGLLYVYKECKKMIKEYK